MSGFSFAMRRGTATGAPNFINVLLGKSTQIHAGDVLILTTHSTYSDGITAVARPLFSGDTITTSNGLIGVAPIDIQTDSSGKLTTVTSSVTVDTRGKLNVDQQYTNVFKSDPDTGYIVMPIFGFDAENIFRGTTDANDVVNYYIVGRSVGVTASAASAPSNYTINDDAGASNAPFVIDDVDTESPQYNSANGAGEVFFHCKDTFYQNDTGNLWTT